MKKLLLALILTSSSAFATLTLFNNTFQSYASLRMLSGPFSGQCLTSLLSKGAYSASGVPSRLIEDWELNGVCRSFPCQFQMHLGGASCEGFVMGSFSMDRASNVTVLSQRAPHYAFDVSNGFVGVYNY